MWPSRRSSRSAITPVRITFDDFHDTGIFTWNYLHQLGHDKDGVWAAYLASLQEKGLSRG